METNIEIFLSYAREDELLRQRLEKQLSVLVGEGLVSVWHDRNISAGTEWQIEISGHLNSAQIILLLISPDFMKSEYGYCVEMKRAMERQERGEARVIPIILRPVYWQEAPFSKLQVLPTDAKPVRSRAWRNPDEAFFDVTVGIRKVVEELIAGAPVRLTTPVVASTFKADQAEMPRINAFYGREHEQQSLKQWILDERCQIIAVVGIGGIGKTALAATVVEQIKDSFEYIFWRSLQNAPSLKDILQDYITFFSNHHYVELPDTVDSQITKLIELLQAHRCLMIIDNVEAILQVGGRFGRYREGYEDYSKLFQRVGEIAHQSCLLLTSREKPKELLFLEGSSSSIRSLHLSGMEYRESRDLLKDRGLSGSKQAWTRLIELYRGNLLALKLVVDPIQSLFKGDIASFLSKGEVVFGELQDLLKQQFHRLSPFERDIVYWLALEREPVSLETLRNDLVLVESKRSLFDVLNTLLRRSMIETSETADFMLQPVIMEFVTSRLIEQIVEELNKETFQIFESHALMKAHAKDYVRESQIRLVLWPIIQQQLAIHGKARIEQKARNLLPILRHAPASNASYTAGNLLNMLVQAQCDVRNIDFSHLAVKQAYLRGATLPGVNFTHADLTTSVFTDTFSNILSVAFSKSGHLLAAGTITGEIRVWKYPNGEPVLTCLGHRDWVRAVAFSPDNKMIASGSDDQTLLLWDINTGHILHRLQGHSSWIISATFNSTGNLLASGSDDRTIRIWNVQMATCIDTLYLEIEGNAVTFSPTENILACVGENHTIKLWDLYSGQYIKVFQGHSDFIWSLAFSADGRFLISGSFDRTIKLWDINTSECLHTFEGHSDWVLSVSVSSDGRLIASGSKDRTMKLWETSTGNCIHTLQGHNDRLWSVAFHPGGNSVASGSEDQTIRLWDVTSGKCINTLQGYTNKVWAIAFDGDGRLLLSGCEDGAIRLWETETEKCLLTLQGHTAWVMAVAFSSDEKMIASSSNDMTLRLWDRHTGRCLHILQGHTHKVQSIAYNPAGSILASASHDQTLRLWETTTGDCLRILKGHTKVVRAVSFHPQGELLASGGDDQIIRLWDVSSSSCQRTLAGHTARIRTIAFSPDGKMLATGSDDYTVRVWDYSSGDCLHILQGHSGQIRAVAFSPDGNMLASGSHDQTVRLWNSRTGECLHTLFEKDSWITSVAFTKNGKTLAMSDYNGTISLWDINTGTLLRSLNNIRPYEQMNITNARGLTKAQRTNLRILGAVDLTDNDFAKDI